MTTALPANLRRSPAPRLRLVGDRLPGAPAVGGDHVAYVVVLPENVDPVALLSAHGVRPEVHPLAGRTPPAPQASAPVRQPVDTAASAPAPESVADVPALTGDDVIRVDAERRIVEVDGRELDLTYLEFGLLAHLVTHPHRVHSRETLIGGIWGYGHVGDGRTVDVHIARLRRKLGPAYRRRIVTVRRVGYKYVP